MKPEPFFFNENILHIAAEQVILFRHKSFRHNNQLEIKIFNR